MGYRIDDEEEYCPYCYLPESACRCKPFDEEYDPCDMDQDDPEGYPDNTPGSDCP